MSDSNGQGIELQTSLVNSDVLNHHEAICYRQCSSCKNAYAGMVLELPYQDKKRSPRPLMSNFRPKVR